MSNRLHSQKLYCLTCNRSINYNESYARCHQCSNFVQCLECLSIGREYDDENITHLRNHMYSIASNEGEPVYCKNWNAIEELNLLHGIKSFGFGNWNAISQHVKTKNPSECQRHYIETYLNSVNSPFPEEGIKEPCKIGPKPKYCTKPQDSSPAESSEQIMLSKGKEYKTTPAEGSGYMPFRHEFEREYHEDAENIITDIEINENESWNSFNLKLNALYCYHSQVIERKFRTSIIEELDIQNIEIPEDSDPDFMGGTTEKEKIIGKKILGLVPFFGSGKTRELASYLRQRNKCKEIIKNKIKFKENLIQTEEEGKLFLELKEYISDGKVIPNEMDNWNRKIEKFNFYNNDMNEKISQKEREMCMREFIDIKLYLEIKNLLIREFTLKTKLSKEEALHLLPDKNHEIALVFDFCVGAGWICN